MIEKAIARTSQELSAIATSGLNGQDTRQTCIDTLVRIEILRAKIVDCIRKEEGV